ncbi:MAG: ATP-binding cassette domain-containing protein [Candidatus Enteromonas sp.]|nr:ATP-binding cassette domain-containing protein [Candidatus Enteromonas sp.]
MSYAIKADGVTKSYNHRIVLDRVSITVEPGEIYGFIGPNGAGKTTLMKVLLGLTEPTEGTVSFFDGMDVSLARRQIGSLIETPAFYPSCTGFENLRRYAILTGDNDSEINRILRLVKLDDAAGRKAGHYSLGMKQRLGIAMALLGHPKALILDEPNNGLDPEGIRNMRELILRVAKEENMAVMISSHILDELARVSTRFGLINKGHLVRELSAEELERECHVGIYLTTPSPKEAEAALSAAGLTDPEDFAKGDSIFLKKKGLTSLEVSRVLFSAGIMVTSLEERETDIEEFVLRLLREDVQ